MNCVNATKPPSLTTFSKGKDQIATKTMSYIFRTLRGNSAVLHLNSDISYENFLRAILEKSVITDYNVEMKNSSSILGERRNRKEEDSFQGRTVKRRLDDFVTCTFTQCLTDLEENEEECKTMDTEKENFSQLAYVVHNGKVLDKAQYDQLVQVQSTSQHELLHHISLHLRLRGGVDRQNRVGSKFGGGGVSSAQQSERERKERLRQLALETVDLAKDPYLMRNHLGTYECKLCLTLHTNEG